MAAPLLLAGWLFATGAAADTVLEIRRGDRVLVNDLAGRVEVVAWGEARMSLTGGREEVRDLRLRRDGDRILVEGTEGRQRGKQADLRLRLPAWAPVEIRGRRTDVSVEGMAGELEVHVVEGDIRVRDAGGVAVLTTVEGSIEVDGAAGRVSALSRGDDVVMRRVRGEVEAQSGSGDIRLEEMAASRVRAETLDGDLLYQGIFAPSGSYTFSVHDGDADVVIPVGADVRVRVATFDGEFSSEIPVVLQSYGGRGLFEFTLGRGQAALEVQVFDGEIRLLDGGRSQGRRR